MSSRLGKAIADAAWRGKFPEREIPHGATRAFIASATSLGTRGLGATLGGVDQAGQGRVGW